MGQGAGLAKSRCRRWVLEDSDSTRALGHLGGGGGGDAEFVQQEVACTDRFIWQKDALEGNGTCFA